MTARPRAARPISAVYLGSDPIHLTSSPPALPDLPEPPSPVSSTGSGLPSPPATNSTGSGSTGDPASITFRGSAHPVARMLNASNLKAFHAAFSSPNPDPDDDEDDEDNANENNEDDTARLTRRHSLRALPPNENALAIQRAMTLRERTRMTIDKLSSYSRNSPSPSLHARTTDSSSSSSSFSSRRPSEQQHQQPHSGSETEREPMESSSRPNTPKLNRTRLVSAPASPAKALSAIKQSDLPHSPSRPRKRASMAMSDLAHLSSRVRSPDSQTSRRRPDVAQAALAAVASSRGRVSPVNSTRKRQPLPREFFESSNSNSGSTTFVSRKGSISSSNEEEYDRSNDRLSSEPMTPHRPPSRPLTASRYLQLSPRQQKNLNSTLTHSSLKYPLSDPRSTLERSSTLRRHQTGGRWVSEDMSRAGGREVDHEDDDLPNARGRKQTLRSGGSADSVLTVGAAGRSLVGEGLRAAGLKNSGTLGRRADIFDDHTPLREKVVRDKEQTRRLERSKSRSQSRNAWGEDDDNEHEQFSTSRGRAIGSELRTRAGTVVGPRATTSMAILDRAREGVGGAPEPRTAPPHLRSYKSAYILPGFEGRVPSSLSRHEPLESRWTNTGDISQLNVPDRSDHTRLLHDSLRMFETHVARVPSTSSATASDLLRNAQVIAGSAEKLNFMMRVAMASALDAQINAEVEGGAGDLAADIWRHVGAEYRDQMRVSDELVRSVTDFLLGVGRAVKDMTGGIDGHGRSVSLDELSGRLTRSSLNSDGGSTGSARRSTESRKSWSDDIQRGLKNADSGSNDRPSSVLRARERETPPNRSRQLNNSHDGLVTLDSQETIMALDPSPTPASRTQPNRTAGTTLDRSRTLPPLSIPKPLGQLPSESSNRRQTQTPASAASKRRPPITGSNTVRGPFPLTSPNMPTTALTPHTVSNGDRQDFPLLRSDSGSGSGKPSGAPSRSTVTFSRSSTVSALTGLQQQLSDQQRQRQRTQSNSSINDPSGLEPISRTTSGSESDRVMIRTAGRQANRSRVSLDGPGVLNDSVHPADRSAATSILISTSQTRDRRKTVADVWPRGAT
ncbi:hypothetical protein D9757_007010 [Collybiopsis confluens]|uniref:Uncharacterized protein n=1 Tax=Collybiopsis confluens TaxID=2823264 RepID=A0A8H5M4R2_9AGAR|nr:hypothetical protein D9757_007010 [Collybiopsis confluens]